MLNTNTNQRINPYGAFYSLKGRWVMDVTGDKFYLHRLVLEVVYDGRKETKEQRHRLDKYDSLQLARSYNIQPET